MKRRNTIAIGVLTVSLVVVAAAFAYFTWTGTVAGNTVTTGSLTFTTWGGPFTINGLMPGEEYAKTYYVAIKNENSIDTKVRAKIANATGDNLLDIVKVVVTLNPSDAPWTMTPRYGSADYVHDPLTLRYLYDTGLDNTKPGDPLFGPGEYAVYKLEIYLDETAGNAYQGKSMGFDLVWTGGQGNDPGF